MCRNNQLISKKKEETAGKLTETSRKKEKTNTQVNRHNIEQKFELY